MSKPPPQSPLIAPRDRKRDWRPSGATPTQLIPAPHTTATPQPRSVPARSTANVSLPTAIRPAKSAAAPPPDLAPRGGAAARALLAGEADPRQQDLGEVGPVAGPRLVEQVLQQRDAAVEPDVVRRAHPAAHEREHRAVVAHQREIGLGVAAVDGEHDGHVASSRAISC